MSEQDTSLRGPRMKLWVRVILFASLALNLVVAGIVAGVIWRHVAGPAGDDRGPRIDKMSIAYIRALDREDKRAIRDELRGRSPGRAALRAQMRDSFSAILDSLRADSFDRDALAAQMRAQFAIGADQRRRVRSLVLDRIAMMSLTDRRAFAARLEAELTRLTRRDGKRGAHPRH
jgi:uncharacterized membrane protein